MNNLDKIKNSIINKTSEYTGVHWHKPAGKWQAQIYVNGWSKHLGLFTSEVEAAQAYNEAFARKHHIVDARINDVPHMPHKTSKYRGVSWNKPSFKWIVRIYIKETGQQKHIGSYTDEIMAAKAYDRAARKYIGKHAKLNLSTPKYLL